MTIADNLRQVRAQIAGAARSVNRAPEEIDLVIVTKGHPVSRVEAAIAAGAEKLGENYIQEAQEKMAAIGRQPGIAWHMIGHVQSRKAKDVVQDFDWLHSLDRLKLAARLDRYAAEAGRILPVLLECNVSGEESKYGWPAWQEKEWPELRRPLAKVLGLKNLAVYGLMTMAPFFEDPEADRPYFRRLRRLRDYLQGEFPQTSWNMLSMGMSADFQVAIQEGATVVRIGTAIMGPRPES